MEDVLYMKPLKSLQLNYLYLMRLIPIEDICIQILKQKKKIEYFETYNYHVDMWEMHASKYYKCLDRKRLIYSFIHNDKEIFAERDRQMDYYNYTGISYQVRNLVLSLISEYYNEITLRREISKEEKKSWRIEDDIKYCKIANKIIEKFYPYKHILH